MTGCPYSRSCHHDPAATMISLPYLSGVFMSSNLDYSMLFDFSLSRNLQNAARAAAAASNKQRSAAEERIAAAVSDALHLIGGLKMAAPLLAAPSVSVGHIHGGIGNGASFSGYTIVVVVLSGAYVQGSSASGYGSNKGRGPPKRPCRLCHECSQQPFIIVFVAAGFILYAMLFWKDLRMPGEEMHLSCFCCQAGRKAVPPEAASTVQACHRGPGCTVRVPDVTCIPNHAGSDPHGALL
eukprot:1136456-Pelagomonas_calceolata.AAC.2